MASGSSATEVTVRPLPCTSSRRPDPFSNSTPSGPRTVQGTRLAVVRAHHQK
jgi:hypothetical protein